MTQYIFFFFFCYLMQLEAYVSFFFLTTPLSQLEMPHLQDHGEEDVTPELSDALTFP